MNVEKLIAKGVKKHFTGQEVLFDVASLEEHYDGLKYHDSDVIYLEEGELVVGYIKSSDVDGENATENEVITQEEVNQIEVVIEKQTFDETTELTTETLELPKEKKVAKPKVKK